MNVLKLEQREEVITAIEKQLKEQHDLAKESVEPVSVYLMHQLLTSINIDSYLSLDLSNEHL